MDTIKKFFGIAFVILSIVTGGAQSAVAGISVTGFDHVYEGLSAVNPDTTYTKKGQYYKDEDLCTDEDLDRIDRFDRKANRNVDEIMELYAEAKADPYDNRTHRKLKHAQKFFSSDEYMEMNKVYKRCNLEIPAPQ